MDTLSITQEAQLRIKINQHRIRDIDDFTYGRLYQLVSDKSKRFVGPERRYEIASWLKKSSKDEIIAEAIKILNDYETKLIPIDNRIGNKLKRFQQKRKQRDEEESNDWAYPFKKQVIDKISNPFHLGRCVQFLLDTNGKRFKVKSLTREDEIKRLMVEEKTMVLEKQIGTVHISYSLCECERYTPGEKRCECGNRRIGLEYKDPDVGDTYLYYCEYAY